MPLRLQSSRSSSSEGPAATQAAAASSARRVRNAHAAMSFSMLNFSIACAAQSMESCCLHSMKKEEVEDDAAGRKEAIRMWW